MSNGEPSFPRALPHGELREVVPDVFFVTGTIKMGAALRFSRNMTVVREGDRLVIVNSVRLSDAGLAKLDALGRVTDVVRIAGFHGMDDPFYKARYGARVWAIAGHKYTKGFDQNASEYLTADEALDASKLPITDAKLHVFDTRPPEGILVLARSNGVAITGDSLQNWSKPDEYFTFAASVMMRLMGFIKPHNVGPAWFKQAKPSARSMRAVLDLDFENLLPAHGAPVLGGAKRAYTPRIEQVVSSIA